MKLSSNHIEDYKVLIHPQMTEKSSILGKTGQLVFIVQKTATKPEIKLAVERMFEIKVKSVRTINVKGYERIFRKIKGFVSGYKKAIISLENSQDVASIAGE